MTGDKLQVTVDEWARLQARAIVKASKKQAGKEGADVTMLHVAKIVLSLVQELEFAGLELPGYGSGWLELIRDFCDDRLK